MRKMKIDRRLLNNKKIECKKVGICSCREFRVEKFAKKLHKCLMIKITIMNLFGFFK